MAEHVYRKLFLVSLFILFGSIFVISRTTYPIGDMNFNGRYSLLNVSVIEAMNFTVLGSNGEPEKGSIEWNGSSMVYNSSSKDHFFIDNITVGGSLNVLSPASITIGDSVPAKLFVDIYNAPFSNAQRPFLRSDTSMAVENIYNGTLSSGCINNGDGDNAYCLTGSTNDDGAVVIIGKFGSNHTYHSSDGFLYNAGEQFYILNGYNVQGQSIPIGKDIIIGYYDNIITDSNDVSTVRFVNITPWAYYSKTNTTFLNNVYLKKNISINGYFDSKNYVAKYHRFNPVDSPDTNWNNITWDLFIPEQSTIGIELLNGNNTHEFIVGFDGILRVAGCIHPYWNGATNAYRKIVIRVMVNGEEQRCLQASADKDFKAYGINILHFSGTINVNNGDIIWLEYKVDDVGLDLEGDSDFDNPVSASINFEKISNLL